MLVSAAAGLGLGFSLIVAIGAQNLFVLRQGMRREHVVLVAAICAASDAVLIALGVSGIGLALQALPWLTEIVRWAGAAFLVTYGCLAARRAWRPSGAVLTPTAATATQTGAIAVASTALALTWLNPHVYLDTVFLLGSIAATHVSPWAFAAGAIVASAVWFSGLAFGARYLGRLLSTERAWRILDASIAVVMIGLGISLVVFR
ncbi:MULTISPECIES: LysE/ArgO family amino acid transporter [unclassified Microbacterium]|uniref:LysE/ArgO family amino acid transporter n=1 Tax=unclassified Microbacterium TaxID=2609290 RepID=UPI000C2BAA2A|nr:MULTISPECIES: LysE/ArgO family amino acid transporter [unclassified Microbacterium]